MTPLIYGARLKNVNKAKTGQLISVYVYVHLQPASLTLRFTLHMSYNNVYVHCAAVGQTHPPIVLSTGKTDLLHLSTA